MGQVYREISEMPEGVKRAVTVGNFDGFHRGHRAILDTLIQAAQAKDLQPLLLTFNPHPRSVIRPDLQLKMILTPEEEIQTLQEVFSGDILVLTFDENIRELSADSFVREVLIRTLGMSVLVSGENNTLGKNRQGDVEYLKAHASEVGYEFIITPKIELEGRAVSSSLIRERIASGDISGANQALCRPYRLSGEVIRGLGLGKKLGYPTANLAIDARKVLPGEGIYATRVRVGSESFGGMLFVGKNHMDPKGSYSVEANILEFDRDIYGEVITYEPIAFVRGNQKFDSQQALVEQIEKDKEIILNILKRTKENSSDC